VVREMKVGNLLTGDCQINCTGQKPHSELIAQLSPSCISETGHIKIKPTLQIADDAYPNIYVCGEVADTKTPNPNARSASRQAWVVAANILKLVQGKKPTEKYENFWADGLIKLTLGLVSAAPGFSTLALLSPRLILFVPLGSLRDSFRRRKGRASLRKR
jgi:NADH dehydrogenase FAD-containing subunit